MARLNEAAPPAESVDALKRRFIRQNREIARANSTQSQRIRTLEAETSRLLSENIALREENIRLEHEVSRGRHALALVNVGSIREKLEAKVAELSSLVVELGKAESLLPDASLYCEAPSRRSPKQSPDQKTWKNALTLSEVTRGQDGRLPAIVEDKYYPRRTLDADEILNAFSEPTTALDSPDLGPPPIAYFDDRDPIKQDLTELHSPSQGSTTGPKIVLDQSYLVSDNDFSNLEVRRKRRASTFAAEPNSDEGCKETEHHPPTRSVETREQRLRTGAKRKLGARDVQDTGASAGMENFQFNRKASSSTIDSKDQHFRTNSALDDPSRDSLQHAAMDRNVKNTRPDNALAALAASRRALGEKSVNTDPVVSPRKSRSASSDKLSDVRKENSKEPRDREATQEKPSTIMIIEPPQDGLEPQITTIALPAPVSEKPAQGEFAHLSRQEMEPSTARPESSRDTSPPPELDIGRPSRRQKTTVRYAEPNLRDKMRRPSKQMVDAVGADERTKRATSAKAEDGASTDEADRGGARPVATIKKEADDDPTASSLWSAFPEGQQGHHHSGASSAPGGLPPTVITDRKRRASILHRPGPPTPGEAPAPASSTIAALVAGSNRRLSRAREEAARRIKASEAFADVYEVDGSSGDDGARGHRRHSRASRRYSSVPEGLKAPAAGATDADAGAGGKDAVPLGTRGSGRSTSRRRDGTAVLEGGGAREALGRGQQDEHEEEEEEEERTAATRRRSMVL